MLGEDDSFSADEEHSSSSGKAMTHPPEKNSANSGKDSENSGGDLENSGRKSGKNAENGAVASATEKRLKALHELDADEKREAVCE